MTTTADERVRELDLAAELARRAAGLHAAGLFGQAGVLAYQALLIRRKHLRGTDPELSQSLNDLGVIFIGTGELSAAVGLLGESLEARLRLFPNTPSPELVQSRHNLGRALLAAGDVPRASDEFRHALELLRGVYGDPASAPEFPALAADLAEAAIAAGDSAAARAHLEAELAARDAAGEDGPGLVRCLRRLGEVRAGLGDRGDALALLRRAAAVAARAYPAELYPRGHPARRRCENALRLLEEAAPRPAPAAADTKWLAAGNDTRLMAAVVSAGGDAGFPVVGVWITATPPVGSPVSTMLAVGDPWTPDPSARHGLRVSALQPPGARVDRVGEFLRSPGFAYLSLDDCRWVNDDLVARFDAYAAGRPGALETLALSYTSVTDRSLALIAAWDTLRALWMRGCAVTIAGVRRAARLPRLEELRLANCPLLGPDVVAELTGCDSLAKLELGGEAASDAGLALLSRTSVRELRLLNAQLSRHGLRFLERSDALRSVEIVGPVRADPRELDRLRAALAERGGSLVTA